MRYAVDLEQVILVFLPAGHFQLQQVHLFIHSLLQLFELDRLFCRVVNLSASLDEAGQRVVAALRLLHAGHLPFQLTDDGLQLAHSIFV